MTAAILENKSSDSVKNNSAGAIDKPDDTLKIIGRLFDYMSGGDKRAKFIQALIIRVIALVCLTALPFLTGQAINVVSDPGGTVADLQRWVTIAAAAGVVYLVMTFFAERLFADLATKALQKLQDHLFSHMQTLSLTFFDRQPIGQLMSRITNDTEVVSLFYEQAVSPIIRASIQILLTFLAMLLIDWRLTIVALIIVPVILILTNVMNVSQRPPLQRCRKNWAH
jgi:ATP-binding cassette subfamily B protein